MGFFFQREAFGKKPKFKINTFNWRKKGKVAKRRNLIPNVSNPGLTQCYVIALWSFFFFSWPYPRRVFQCIGLWNTIRYGVPYEMVLCSSYILVILVLIASSSSHRLSTILSGRVLQRGWPGSIVLAGVRHAAVNKVVPLALVHSLYSPLVTAC